MKREFTSIWIPGRGYSLIASLVVTMVCFALVLALIYVGYWVPLNQPCNPNTDTECPIEGVF